MRGGKVLSFAKVTNEHPTTLCIHHPIGAVTAMHDAIALANLMYAIPSNSFKDITPALREYQAERYPAAIESFKSSQQGSRVLEKGPTGAVALYVSTHAPLWLWRNVLEKMLRHRPLVGFLDSIERKGTVAPVISPSTEKARALFERRRKSQQKQEKQQEKQEEEEKGKLQEELQQQEVTQVVIA